MSAGRSTLSQQQKRVLVVALVVHLVMVILTWRDLSRKPEESVGGSKWLWRAAATLNTTGSIAYWVFGRRRLAGSNVSSD
jgi:hypothetical protein